MVTYWPDMQAASSAQQDSHTTAQDAAHPQDPSQDPSQGPGYPQDPGQGRSYPQDPGQGRSYPQDPGQDRSYPQGPGYPQDAGYPAARHPGDPGDPGYASGHSGYPTSPDGYPGTPGGYPGTPAGYPAPQYTSSGPAGYETADYPVTRSERRAERRPDWRHRLIVTGCALGLAGLAASTAGVVIRLLPRSFNTAQQQQIASWEIGKRWRTWPAGRIFPISVPYQLAATALESGTGVQLSARRVGIAPEASCKDATDAAAWQVLGRHGCSTVLRATYRDATGAFAVTIGIAVLPSPAQASESARALSGTGGQAPAGLAPGVQAVPFGHTVVASFGDAARQMSTAVSSGSYVIMSTVGYADGRHFVRESADPYDKDEMLSVADGLAHFVSSTIGAPPPPEHCPGGPAC